MYESFFRDLLGKFKDARSKGLHVDFNWLWSKRRKIYREQTVDENAVLEKHLIANFIKRNNLKQRKTHNKKSVTKEVQKSTAEVTWTNGIQHCERAILPRAGEPDYDKKCGRYLPLQRFDIDQ